MLKETKSFLDFFDKKLSTKPIDPSDWKAYIDNLPNIYQQDLSFRLLFDWHSDLQYNVGETAMSKASEPIFSKQIEVIDEIAHLYNSPYQIRELIYYHAKSNLKGKKLLEIGGVSPNDILFDLLGISEYINIESPDYIDLEDGISYSEKFKPHEKKKTILCNAEDINSYIENESQDFIFSVACFEHIYDLEKALISCHSCLKNNGYLYSYFAPIYSSLEEGDHGVIPDHKLFETKPIGLHLLSANDQRKRLIKNGIRDPREIQDLLANINFNRCPNRLLYEDYEKILTESPFFVFELKRLDFLNLSKKYSLEIKEIRESNPLIGNMISIGFRVLLGRM